MNTQDTSPVLVYDGECGICYEWISYWQKLTGGAIHYRPYQEVQGDYPDISLTEFEQAIQFIDSDGSVYSGAEATFTLYRAIPGHGLLKWLYSYFPGFALFSEIGYNFLSQHRGLLSFFTHLFWGKNFEPTRYQLTTRIFLRVLGCIYLAAFVSFGVQVTGLIGSDGVLPLEQYLPQLEQHFGSKAYWQTPMLFWLYLSDSFLQLTCVAGALLSCLLVLGFFQRSALILLYLLYLSLFYAGQSFMTFQWDILLLEAGFLAIFLPSGTRLVIWLYRWLIFRFMFLGGLVKIISRDPNWDGLTALNFHFETQPLPTVFAWYAHHLPESLLMAGVALTLIIELILPFLIFAPRRLRMFAACCFIIFQSLIILTGNYNFFNLLTIAICLFLFDDTAFESVLPAWLKSKAKQTQVYKRDKILTYAFVPLAVIILLSSIEQMGSLIKGKGHETLSSISRAISPWHIAQNYGPFAVMTTVRREIVIEGSGDGETWQEYHFKYKPGDLAQAPRWVTPHQPRLDWQMWFAALSEPEHNPWFRNLLYHLLLNNEAVTKLLAINPFPDSSPKLVRARFYEYHFSTSSEKKASGRWWTRELIGDYYPPIQLSMKIAN
jgi:predicted DCC family thiol-disulfide oxidoreductase YuxK